MIQRIQTLFLFIASVLLLVMLFYPLSTVTNSSTGLFMTLHCFYAIDVNGATVVNFSLITIGVLIVITTIIGFLDIFLYKSRKKQMLLCAFAIFFSFILCNLIVLNSFIMKPNAESNIFFSFVAIFPIVSFILFILAYRGINKDEKLIKSLDRIR